MLHTSLNTRCLLHASALTLCALLSVSGATASTLTVPTQYRTIQAAINAAKNGDTVLINPGTYSGPGNVNLDTLGKAITVKGKSGARTVILDGSGVTRLFFIRSGEGPNTVITGLTITHGYAQDGAGTGGNNGGGIALANASSPTITNCIFANNYAANGGGFFCGYGGGTPALSNCTFYNNRAIYGGASYVIFYNATFTNCTFLDNVAVGDGGGLLVEAGGSNLIGCRFNGNTASNLGGGVWVFLGSGLHVTGGSFDSNTVGAFGSGNGGGIQVDGGSAAEITDSTFSNNEAGGNGGAIDAEGNVATTGSTFTKNIAYYAGGAINLSNSNSTVSDCNFYKNNAPYGGALFVDYYGSPTISGSEFKNNTAQDGGAICDTGYSAITSSQFGYNQANYGGAICGIYAYSSYTENVFVRNAAGDGGAVYANGSYFDMVNSTFVANSASNYGGAVEVQDYTNLTATNCSFTGNSAAQGLDAVAVFNGCQVGVYNSIVWDSQDHLANNELGADGSSGLTVSYCDVYGSFTGAGNIAANPLFVNPLTLDLSLKPGSPCLHAGSGSVPYAPATDILGVTRSTTTPSMGAYEN